MELSNRTFDALMGVYFLLIVMFSKRFWLHRIFESNKPHEQMYAVIGWYLSDIVLLGSAAWAFFAAGAQ